MKYRNLAESTQRIYTSAVRELALSLTTDGGRPLMETLN